MPEASATAPDATLVRADLARLTAIGRVILPGQFPETKEDFDFLVSLLTTISAEDIPCADLPAYAAATKLLQSGMPWQQVRSFGLSGVLEAEKLFNTLPDLEKALQSNVEAVRKFAYAQLQVLLRDTSPPGVFPAGPAIETGGKKS